MTPEDAIEIIARRAIYCACGESGMGVEWGDYPEIGENDWHAILTKIEELTAAPGDFTAAYALLEARADPAAEPRP